MFSNRLSSILIVLGVVFGIGQLIQLAILTKLDALPFLILVALVFSLALIPIIWSQLPWLWKNIIWLGTSIILIYLVYFSRFSIGTYLLPGTVLILLGGLNAWVSIALTTPKHQNKVVIGQSTRMTTPDVNEEFRQRLRRLTPRETEILKFIEDGKSNLEISTELVLSTNTIRYHVHQILKKLNCTSRSEAALKIKIINSI